MGYRGEWDPGYIQYDPGDVVMYNGGNYRIVQPHKSQSDWPPSLVPALWEHLSDYKAPADQSHCAPDHPQQPTYQQPHQPQQQQPYQAPAPAPTQPTGGYTTQTGVQVTSEESKKPWYDLDDDKKKLLWGGGALALGLGALAGGYYVHNEKHRKEGEEEKAQAFELQNWIMASRQHTEEFLRLGARAPLTWVFSDFLSTNPNLRSQLIQGGEENGQTWYIARALHHGGLQPGKARLEEGAYIGFGNEAIQVKQYEVLVGNPQATRWVDASGKLKVNSLPYRPVEGGKDVDGSPLYICRAEYKGGLHPGKASALLHGGYITYGHKEKGIDNYEVLCYA